VNGHASHDEQEPLESVEGDGHAEEQVKTDEGYEWHQVEYTGQERQVIG